jgi:hypothetical protein
MRLHDAMCDEVRLPAAPAIVEFVEELTRRHGFDSEDGGFLSVDVSADARGVVVPTWWGTTMDNVGAVLDGTTAPYLSHSLLADLIARPHPRCPFFVVKRVEQQFIQAFIQANGMPAILEYRAGSAEHHYQAEASDREVVRDVVWAWATESAGWETAVAWQPMKFPEDA